MDAEAGKGSVWAETRHGFQYILARQSLVAIFLLFTASNIHSAFGYSMMTPMILAKTGDDSVTLGMSHSAGSLGFLAGGLLMSVWGGPKKRIHAVNLSFILWGLCGTLVFGPAWSLPYWLAGSFMMGHLQPNHQQRLHRHPAVKSPARFTGAHLRPGERHLHHFIPSGPTRRGSTRRSLLRASDDARWHACRIPWSTLRNRIRSWHRHRYCPGRSHCDRQRYRRLFDQTDTRDRNHHAGSHRISNGLRSLLGFPLRSLHASGRFGETATDPIAGTRQFGLYEGGAIHLNAPWAQFTCLINRSRPATSMIRR